MSEEAVVGNQRRSISDPVLPGQLTPAIDRTYPLSDAAEALRFVGAGHTRGKVVVTT